MTNPFMRVDVSQSSRDFQPVAIEPGLPLLDRSNSNGQVLRKWLGELVAEPERVGDRVGFFVRDSESRRIDSVFCLPVSDKDLASELAKNLQELRQRIDAVKPLSPNEQLIHRVVSEQVRNLTGEDRSRERRICLFKFRDGRNKLHLVWVPGYTRRDNEPATTQVCTNPACAHLFLQRPGMGTKCPVCKAIRQPISVDHQPGGFAKTLKRLIAFVLFVALGVGGTFWWTQYRAGPKEHELNAAATQPLVVEPAEWTGPIGSRVEFVVTRRDGDSPIVVTSSAEVTVANPKCLSVKPYENIGKALSPGTTSLTFFVGNLKANAVVTVTPRTRPEKLVLRPDRLELGVGTTAQIKLFGEFEAGMEVDLTDDADWDANQDGKFFVQRGLVEGEEAGTGTLRVQYRADESDAPQEATASIVIRDHQYQSLKLVLKPESLVMGKPGRLHVAAVCEDGTELDADGSKDLIVDIAPSGLATVNGSEMVMKGEGDVKITAQFRGLTSSLETKIGPDNRSAQLLIVNPKSLELKVGELARLSVLSANPSDVRVKSSESAIVEVSLEGGIIGRGVGEALIEVSNGGEPITIPTRVTLGKWDSIVIEPAAVSIRLNESAVVTVFGVLSDSSRVQLVGDQLTWVSLPRPEVADFDKLTMQLRGLRPTGDHSEQLATRFQTLEASVDVEVVSSPLVLTLAPQGSIEIPVGQKRAILVKVQSGSTPPAAVSDDDIEWLWSSESGLAVKNGEIHATREGDQSRLAARYQGVTSNEIRVSAVSATPVTLSAIADPATLPIGNAGIVKVRATGPGGAVDLSEEGLRFSTSAPKTVDIVPTTGAFRALAPGQAVIRVSHSSARQPAEVTITVIESVREKTIIKPAALRLISPQGDSIQLPLGAKFSDWKVEAVANDGTVTNVSQMSTLVVESDPTTSDLKKPLEDSVSLLKSNLRGDAKRAAVIIRNRQIVANQPGQAAVQAIYGGIRTTTGLKFDVVASIEIDEIKVNPIETNLMVGESATLGAEGFRKGKSVGDITSRGEVKWESANPNLVTVDGPQVNAKQVGSTTVMASVGSVKSKPAKITVASLEESSTSPTSVGRLVVVPKRLRMKAGEVAVLGQDFIVKRQASDFSDSCQVSVPPSSRIVSYDKSSRTIRALSPGHSHVTLIVRDQSATLELDVEPEIIAAKDAIVVIEPATSQLVVGERLPLRVYTVAADGTRSAVTAALSSNDPKVAAIDGTSVSGLATGEVTIEAKVPGVQQVGTAVFKVEAMDFERLAFNPSSITVGVGQTKPFEIYGITKDRRVKLGDGPNLKLVIDVGDGRGTTQDYDGSQEFSIAGANPGSSFVQATWKGALQEQLPYTVVGDEVTDLELIPDEKSVPEGDLVEYQVFARREGRLEPLGSDSGVQLTVANPVLAAASEFQLTTLKAGKTQVIATYGNDRVVANLTITPRSNPLPPPAAAERIRFATDTSRMELSDPGDSLNVLRVNVDGSEDNAGSLVKFTLRDPQDIVEIESTPEGFKIRPKKIGKTEIEATLGNLHTQKPFYVEVVADSGRKPRLRVSPELLRIVAGQSSQFSKADMTLASGSASLSVPFKVTSKDSKIIEVGPDNSIRGISAGTSMVTVTVNDTEGKYKDISCTAAVEVVNPSAQRDSGRRAGPAKSPTPSMPRGSGGGDKLKPGQSSPASAKKNSMASNSQSNVKPKSPNQPANSNSNSGNGGGKGSGSGGGGGSGSGSGSGRGSGLAAGSSVLPKLELSGPSETSVNAEIQLRVDSILGRQSTDVTRQSQLTLVAGDEALAEVRPGCVILAKAPGRIRVQARYNDLTSSSQEIQIRPIATFERLEIEPVKQQLRIGEVVPYKLWGYPAGKGVRQDLTLLVSDNPSKPGAPRMLLKTLEPSADTVIVNHQPGSLTGKQAGRFSMQAQIGNQLNSSIAILEVAADVPQPERISVDPNRIEVLSGQCTPPIKVYTGISGRKTSRTIDPGTVEFISSDPDILRSKEPGIFEGIKPGEARIKVVSQGIEQLIPVTVKYNPFSVIDVGLKPKFANSTVEVDLSVKAPLPPGELEYRVKLPRINERPAEETPWVIADKVGNELVTKLHTPKIPITQGNNDYYSIIIEARDVKSGKIDRTPFSFRLRSESGGAKSTETK